MNDKFTRVKPNKEEWNLNGKKNIVKIGVLEREESRRS